MSCGRDRETKEAAWRSLSSCPEVWHIYKCRLETEQIVPHFKIRWRVENAQLWPKQDYSRCFFTTPFFREQIGKTNA